MAGDRAPLGTVSADYATRGAAFARVEAMLRQQGERLSQVRLVSFVLAAGCGVALLGGRGPGGLLAAGLALGFAAYLVLANRHRALRRRARWSGVRRFVCDQGALRIARDWNALAASAEILVPPDHPYAFDLDVFGHASLARLLDVTSPGPGRLTLVSWLGGAVPTVSEVRARQDAVRELAPAVEWRETLTAHALSGSHSAPRRADVERFLAWAEERPWLVERPLLLWASCVLPVLIIPSVVFAFLAILWGRGLIPPPSAWVVSIGSVAKQLWYIPFAAGVALSAVTRAEIGKRLQSAMSHLTGLTGYAAMLAHVETSTFTSPRLIDLRARLATGRGASRELARLGAVVRLAEARYSPMGHTILQLLGLWDFHVLAALERWQRESGAHARDWLAALGDAEAIGAIATLAYDNPDWGMPELVDGPARVEATLLGHPLLPHTSRVSNDVCVGPPATFLLVTGSNMSGKSTLLRAIGTNVVLAQMGAPVCAASMRLTPVDVWTSIRIDDSLEAGVSLFMAELRRLKRIVDAARDPARARPLLYLLDEILHGTNTAERRVAARRVIGVLLKAGAIGAVTSHDLTLAEDPSLDAAAQRVHFTERFEQENGGATMTFDYRLRPGLATSANALKLLAMIGLGEDVTG